MKTMMPLILAVLLFPFVVDAQPAQATLVPFGPSQRLSVALYSDTLFGPKYGQSFRDPSLKRIAVVVSNLTDQPVVASGVVWKWTGATGKPGMLYLQQDSFRNGVYLAGARSEMLMLPGSSPILPGSKAVGGTLRVPPPLQTASQISVELDVLILADGEVIGPDTYKLVEELKARDQATQIIAKIISYVKDGDPIPEIEKTIANAPVTSALRRYLTDLSRTPRGGKVRMPPQLKPLPSFYRR